MDPRRGRSVSGSEFKSGSEYQDDLAAEASDNDSQMPDAEAEVSFEDVDLDSEIEAAPVAHGYVLNDDPPCAR